MATYKKIVLNERPEGEIDLGKTFRTETAPKPAAADLKDGEALIETLYLSCDPAMRGWIRDERSYLPPVQIGETMRSAGLARVVASKSPDLKEGELVIALTGWAEYAVGTAQTVQKVPDTKGINPVDWLGTLGTTALTAYFGLLDIGDPKPGELVVVSGAAGATGSAAVQLAKMKGARVVGLAGSDDKVKWLKELGCDEALNYKSSDFKAQFDKATESNIDVYFDNVGGEILDMALARAKEHARFVMCGAISQYNAKEAQGPKNLTKVITMRIKMQGFIVMDFMARWQPAREELAKYYLEGKFKGNTHLVKGGIEEAPGALKSLFSGANTGKLVVEVKAA